MTNRRKFLQTGGLAAIAATTSAVNATNAEGAAPSSAEATLQAPVDLTAALEQRATVRMRQRLGIGPDQPLPRDVLNTIRQQAAAASKQAVTLGASSDVQIAAGTFGRVVTQQDFLEKMEAARVGIERISQSKDVDAILKERATLLWKKRKSLEDAGFPAGEAMQILLADIAARAQ